MSIYVKSSLADIRNVIEPLIGNTLPITQTDRATQISFTKSNEDYTMREIVRFIGGGVHHSTMKMNDELFRISPDEKKELYSTIAKAQLNAWKKGSGHFYWNYKLLLDTVNEPGWIGWDSWDLGKCVAQDWYPIEKN